MKKLNFVLLAALLVFFAGVSFGQNAHLLSTPKKIDKGGAEQNVERTLYSLGYDDGSFYTAIGYSSPYTWWAAIKIPAATLASYANGITYWQFVQVRTYHVWSSAEVGIYKVGAGNTIGAAVVPFQTFTPVANSWNTIALNSNPVVSGSSDVWIIWRSYDSGAGFWPFGADNGPANPNGFWYGDTDIPNQMFDLSTWNSYNWMIRGVVNTGICPSVAVGPSPADEAVGVDPDNVVLDFTLPGDETSIEVFFSANYSDVASANPSCLVYGGWPVEQVAIPFRLTWATTYYWRVVTICEGGKVYTDVWEFTTMANPGVVLFFDDFDTVGLANWNVINDGGLCDWDLFPEAGYSLPASATGFVAAADADDCGSGSTTNNLLSTLELASGIDCTDFQGIYLKFDNDWRVYSADDLAYVEGSTNGGATWFNIFAWEGVSVRNTTVTVAVPEFAGMSNCMVRFRTIQPAWDWWWAIDNVEIGAAPPWFVAGDLKYMDALQTELIDFEIELTAPHVPGFVRYDYTDSDGFYFIPYVADGNYEVTSVEQCELPHLQGAVNTHDAWQINRWWQKLDPMPTGVVFDCADLDNNGTITAADATLLMDFLYEGYYDYIHYCWPRAFAAIPNWLYETHDVFVDEYGQFAPTIYARAAGDADGSGYVFDRATKVDKVALTTNSTVLPLTDELTVPVYTNDAAEIGAAMFKFTYNSDVYEFVGVNSKIGVTAKASNGVVGVYYVGNGVSLNAGDEVFALSFRKLDGAKATEFALTVDQKESEMVNKNGEFRGINLSTASFGEIPSVYELAQNFPNPFNPATTISFSLPQADVVTLKVYDILGAEVATLVNGKLEAGKYNYQFNASNLTSGVYVYRITTNNFTSVKKMMLIK